MLLRVCILQMRGFVKVAQLLHRSTYVIPKTQLNMQMRLKVDFNMDLEKDFAEQ